MKVDISLAMSGPLDAVPRAAELQAVGADGLFSFENAHDAFFPLVLASTSCQIDLMTNAAMAFRCISPTPPTISNSSLAESFV